MSDRISSWKNRYLSFGGQLQLVISVLSAMHVYWSLVFILPTRIIKELEAKMRGFLWCQGPMARGKAKVSWDAVCMPKYEGGLGIRRISEMNIALMASNAWSIVIHRESLWVAWIHTYRLKDRNFWDCQIPNNCSWSWRKILQVRSLIQPYIWAKVGNGEKISAWYDKWKEVGPLKSFLSPRAISNAGFNLKTKVKDIWDDGRWCWPEEWLRLYPILNGISQQVLVEEIQDKFYWKSENKMLDFPSSVAWQSVRTNGNEVAWVDIVWFSKCIPKHAFLMWLIMRKKLLTQDKILRWEHTRGSSMNMMCCVLCYGNVDSHDHLFFSCKYSSQVWNLIRDQANMEDVNPVWEEIISWLLDRRSLKKLNNVVARLITAAAAYYIWRERNARLFRNTTRPPDVLAKHILATVRYKLMGMKFKNTCQVVETLRKWSIHGNLIVDGDNQASNMDT
ncbi:putative reverse transcriptase zinc-binding domain-containing protein [Helianthus annuus]|nr:putative reverse transcriptase zinc-binding domain-containing protein [Helianthus annuus]